MTEITTGAGSWLAEAPVVERLALDDTSWIDVVRGLVPRADEVHDVLRDEVAWEQGRVFRYEKWVDDPRLGSWHRTPPHPAVAEVQHFLQRRYKVLFDGVALALYRGPRDGVGYHRDRELRYLDDTVIGVLTLGARRPFVVKPIGGQGQRTWRDADVPPTADLAPASGDLLVMGGRCQADWLHAVPQLHHAVGTRISAQWRWTSGRGRRDANPGFYQARRFGSGGGGGGAPRRPAGGGGPRR